MANQHRQSLLSFVESWNEERDAPRNFATVSSIRNQFGKPKCVNAPSSRIECEVDCTPQHDSLQFRGGPIDDFVFFVRRGLELLISSS